MFQAMASAFLALLLAGIASAYDITNMIGNGNGQGAPNNGQSTSQGSGLTFDTNAAQPILSPGQVQSSQGQGSVSYGNAPAQPWNGPQAVQSNGQDVMGDLLGGEGGPPAGNPSPPSSNGGGQGGGQPATNPMQTLLSGMVSTMGQQQGNNGNFQGGGGIESQPLINHGKFNSQALSVDSQDVVSGLIGAFMHKQNLSSGEKSCLAHNVGQLTGALIGVIGDAAIAIKALVAGSGKITQNSQGPMVNAGLDSAMKITGLVTSATALAKGCVHGDALQMLKDTAHHMVDGNYLRHRFLVSGVDVARELADSVIAFEHHNFNQFGADIGTALRKILLSDDNSATRLPEGVPEQDIIQQTMDGLTSGFFVRDSRMEITDSANPNVDIRVNLHRCVAGNQEFFKEIFMALWQLIAQLSAHGFQGMSSMFQTNNQQGQPKWVGDLMIAMMQFPMALARCGISASSQGMLTQAVKTLGDLQVHFQFPDDRIQTEQATQKMALAVAAWTNWNFKKFGLEIGKLFRELVMLAFPQQYSVDASGRLQRMSAVSTEELPRSFSSPLVISSGASIFLFVALAAVRTRRALPKELPDNSVPMTDIEDGDDLELVE